MLHSPLKTLPGKGRGRQASDDSSEASSKEFGEEDDDEEGNYDVEEDEEELAEEDSEAEGEWGAVGRGPGGAPHSLQGTAGSSELQRAKG